MNQLIVGKTAAGEFIPVQVDADGKVITADASSATVATGIGAPTDAAATTDTGTFSLISLFKRGLQGVTTLISSLASLVAQKAAMPAVITNALAITRPNDTTAYAAGDLVANSTTAGSVVALQFANAVLAEGGCVRIERIRLYKSTTTTTNASFRLHLYNAAPTGIANGDNGALSTNRAGYIGAFDVTLDRAFVDGAQGSGVSLTGTPMTVAIPAGTTLYGLLEARAAYTPGSAEVFNAVIEGYRF